MPASVSDIQSKECEEKGLEKISGAYNAFLQLRDGSVLIYRDTNDDVRLNEMTSGIGNTANGKSASRSRLFGASSPSFSFTPAPEKVLKINATETGSSEGHCEHEVRGSRTITDSEHIDHNHTPGESKELQESAMESKSMPSHDDVREGVPMIPVPNSLVASSSAPEATVCHVNMVRSLKGQRGGSSSPNRNRPVVPPVYADPSTVLLMGLPPMPVPDT